MPIYFQIFPNLIFVPFSGMLANNDTGVTSATRPFTDVALDVSGTPSGILVAQGNGARPGLDSMAGFSAVLRGSFVVKQAGTYTFNLGSADGFIFGVGNGALRISGAYINAPASGTTVFSNYPIMAVNNGPSTGSPLAVVVSFPAPGAYPYEFDYRSGTGGPLSLAVTLTQGSNTVPLPPLASLVLSWVATGSHTAGTH